MEHAADPFLRASAACHLEDPALMKTVYLQVADAVDHSSAGYGSPVRKSMCDVLGHNISGCRCVRCDEEFHTWVVVNSTYGGAHDGYTYCSECGLYC